MMGWSYGGYAASRAAQRDGGKYRCAISGAGVHDLPDMVAYDHNYLGRYGSQYIGSAAARLADGLAGACSPTQYSAPILIVHGEKDERVPVRSRAIWSAGSSAPARSRAATSSMSSSRATPMICRSKPVGCGCSRR